MLEFLMQSDGNILLYIQEHMRTPVLTPLVVFITTLGNAGLIWVLASLLLLIPKKTRRIGCISILALLGSLLVNNLLLKNLVHRTRPYELVQGLEVLVRKPVDFSFPSGHTGSSFASGLVLFKNLPRPAGAAALVLAGLIRLSRLYVGVHYPSDVLVGMINGIWISFAAEWIYQKIVTVYGERR